MDNNHKRCHWCEGDAFYKQYHDKEWGVPIFDDLKLFEFLTLETFQTGLSWITILRKRDHFRKAFDQFDYEKVARYGDEKINTLLNNQGIIRNKPKTLKEHWIYNKTAKNRYNAIVSQQNNPKAVRRKTIAL